MDGSSRRRAERAEQFRLGLFVLVACLLVAGMIVWFGRSSDSLFARRGFVIARFDRAPGVETGVPVRKSGIPIGEVASVALVDLEEATVVEVTLAIDPRFHLRDGARPRIARGLIGDVVLEFEPGHGRKRLHLATDPASATVIEGITSIDPTQALEEAAKTFQDAGQTLDSIDEAARSVSALAGKLRSVDTFLETWTQTGTEIDLVASELRGVVVENRDAIGPTLDEIREAADRIESTLDEPTRTALQSSIARLDEAVARLDDGLTDLKPLLVDLGRGPNEDPATRLGQTLMRIDRIAGQIGLLTAALDDGNGRLNPDGTLQRLLTRGEVADGVVAVTQSIDLFLRSLRPAVRSLTVLLERVARDPAILTRGVLGID